MQGVSKRSPKSQVRVLHSSLLPPRHVYPHRYMQSARAQPQLATYCGTFRTSPNPPPSSWVVPVVAPVQPDFVAKPSEYRFASRAPVTRRSPSTKHSATKHPKSNTAYHGQPSVSSTNGVLSASSYANQNRALEQRHYDPGNQYDDFLATFQHRIDGMTGQRGGWGF